MCACLREVFSTDRINQFAFCLNQPNLRVSDSVVLGGKSGRATTAMMSVEIVTVEKVRTPQWQGLVATACVLKKDSFV